MLKHALVHLRQQMDSVEVTALPLVMPGQSPMDLDQVSLNPKAVPLPRLDKEEVTVTPLAMLTLPLVVTDRASPSQKAQRQQAQETAAVTARRPVVPMHLPTDPAALPMRPAMLRPLLIDTTLDFKKVWRGLSS